MWIALEGPDGVGKTSQAALLAKRTRALLTRESGGTPIGARIREIFLDSPNMKPMTEAYLMAADRAQHIREVVLPAQARGCVVVSDRSVFSSMAYQGYGRQLGASEVWGLNALALDGALPDIVVLLDGDPETLAARMEGRAPLDRLELEDVRFKERVRLGFQLLASEFPEIFVEVNAEGDVITVHDAIVSAVYNHPAMNDHIRQIIEQNPLPVIG